MQLGGFEFQLERPLGHFILCFDNEEVSKYDINDLKINKIIYICIVERRN